MSAPAPAVPSTADERRRACVPHEIFLTNLIVNHILVFVATLGMASHDPEVLALVPALSCAALSYTLWRTRRARTQDAWFVRVHWEASARHSRFFLALLAAIIALAAAAWWAHGALGLRREMALALAAGLALLPTLVAVVVLVVIESELLQQARHGRVPAWLQRRFPPA